MGAADVTKNVLRRAIRADRAAEPMDRRQERADQLARHALALQPWARSGVAAFLPTNAEPDIGLLVRALAAPVYLPRVAGTVLEWVQAEPAHVVGIGRGIPKPAGPSVAVGAELVSVLGVRLLLVPAVAVDPDSGIRLGYGAGFYDRFLGQVRRLLPGQALAVGVCRSADLVPVPAESHDEPMDGVLTERGLTWIAGQHPAPLA